VRREEDLLGGSRAMRILKPTALKIDFFMANINSSKLRNYAKIRVDCNIDTAISYFSV